MTDFGPWLRPTLFGPFFSTFAITTLAHLMWGEHADEVLYAGHAFDSWVVSMLLSAFVAAGLVVSLIVADVTLLRAKLRKLPTGLGAWVSAMLAPFALFFGWHLMGAPSESVLEAVLRFAVPFPASALALRFVLGRRP